MVNKATVRKKLVKLKAYLEELNRFESLTWDEYRADFQHRRTVERLIQLIVDVAVDKSYRFTTERSRGEAPAGNRIVLPVPESCAPGLFYVYL